MQKKISKVLEKCMFKVENVNSKYNVNIENINIKNYIPACLNNYSVLQKFVW